MSVLTVSDGGELHLTLRGADEDRILTTMRGLPYWLRATIERDPHNSQMCLSVTLVADRTYEPMVREILKRGFGLVFPTEGGSCALPPVDAPPPRKRRI
jgi:hypothetical protein